MMNLPKILIACPIIDRNRYCIDKYIECLKSLTYPNKEFLLVDNSATEEFYNELKAKGINVIRGKHFDKAVPALVYNRNIIRSYFLARDFDYLFSLDSDVMCQPDAIEKLLAHKKELVTGVYYSATIEQGKITAKPMLFVKITDEEFSKIMQVEQYKQMPQIKKEDLFRQLTKQEIQEPKLLEVDIAGLGAVLIKREVLEKTAFTFDADKKATDDFFFFEQTAKQGYKLYCDTTVKCTHLHGGRKS